MISSMLSGQIRQIAIMKATGARRRQIAWMYYLLILVSGVIALIFAIPLATIGARALLDVCASMLNFSVASYEIPWWPYALQIITGLLIPALAATYPIMRGTNITVNDGLKDYGTSKNQYSETRFKPCKKITMASPILLSFRNTFRRPGRLFLTVATLAVGGAILIVSLNIKSSIDNTLNKAMSALNYDLQYYFSTVYSEEKIKTAIGQVPGVAKVETMTGTMSTMIYQDNTESNPFQLAAVDCTLETLNLPVLSGRWLVSDDTNAVVLNHAYIEKEPGLGIGDTITIKSAGMSASWVIVGIVKEVGAKAKAYVYFDYYQKIIGQTGYARAANIITNEQTYEKRQLIATQIEENLRGAGIDVMISTTFEDTKNMFDNHLAIIVGFLVIASILVIIVGIMGLISTTGINVMERMREIGIMRSYGAISRSILHIFIFEGIFVGLISLGITTILSMPLTHLTGNVFGKIFMQVPLDNVLNPWGYLLWLAIMLMIAVLVSSGIALRVLDIPVNEVLNYE
jgi:putative ABC transport system permease protein